MWCVWLRLTARTHRGRCGNVKKMLHSEVFVDYYVSERWPYPNPTGLAGLREGFCPPHFADMRAAVESVCERKFGPGGPFHLDTPGPWKDSRKVRGGAQAHSEEFRECVALQVQYVFDVFGKFPGTMQSIFVLTYLQAHHLDLEFYDGFYTPGAYMRTHATHLQRWHPERAASCSPV